MTDIILLKQLFEAKRVNDFKKKLSQSIKKGLIKRKNKCEIAQMLRKLGEPLEALKLLRPIVRNEKLLELATDDEQIEYASCLYRLGLVSESEKLLNSIEKDYPQKLLFLSFLKFSRWDYVNAVPILDAYLTLDNLTDRDIFIGKLNLASAHIVLNSFKIAIRLLKNCETTAIKNNWDQYLGNIYELLSQIYFIGNDYKKTKEYLNKAESIFKKQNAFGYLFVKKWDALLELKKSEIKYNKVLEEAKEINHFETIRSLNYYYAHLKKDYQLLEKVYLGTPYDHFKKMIMLQNKKFKSSKDFLIFGKNKIVFDQNDYSLTSKKSIRTFKGFELEAKLLEVLSEDYFRPKTGFQIFQRLYEGEYFSPDSSLNKTQKIISRLNLKENCIGFHQNYYFLKDTKVIYNLDKSSHDSYYLNKISNELGNTFKSQDVANVLSISKRQATRILAKLSDEGEVILVKKGRSSFYKKVS